jgi:hypothetical protein
MSVLAPTIFHEPWWLNAATQGRYAEVTFSLGGQTVGRLPYLLKRRLGMNACELPDLTHFLGPAVDEGTGGIGTRALRRMQITRELIRQLPKADYFLQRFHRGTPDTLTFLNEGFRTDVLFTYELEPAPEKTIWQGMRDKTRNIIRRAEEQTELVSLDPAEFIRLYDSNLAARSLVNHSFSPQSGAGVFNAALERGQGRLLGAKDKSGQVVAATFFAWDTEVTYCVLTTRTPDAHNGAISRLIWEGIRDSAAHGRLFDFDGVIESTILLYVGFGGQVRPRFNVYRTSLRYAAMRNGYMLARDSVRKLRGRENAGAS